MRLLLALCCSAWLLAAGTSWASDVDPQEAKIYESELMRLKAISERLQAISVEQNLQLVSSRKKIDSLLNELAGLRIELSALKDESSALKVSAEKSADHSTSLEKEVTRLDGLASNLEESFKQYRADAEREITRLEKSLRFHKFIEKAALALALGGWGAFALK